MTRKDDDTDLRQTNVAMATEIGCEVSTKNSQGIRGNKSSESAEDLKNVLKETTEIENEDIYESSIKVNGKIVENGAGNSSDQVSVKAIAKVAEEIDGILTKDDNEENSGNDSNESSEGENEKSTQDKKCGKETEAGESCEKKSEAQETDEEKTSANERCDEVKNVTGKPADSLENKAATNGNSKNEEPEDDKNCETVTKKEDSSPSISGMNIITPSTISTMGGTALLITNFVLNPEQAQHLSLNTGATLQNTPMASLLSPTAVGPVVSPISVAVSPSGNISASSSPTAKHLSPPVLQPVTASQSYQNSVGTNSNSSINSQPPELDSAPPRPYPVRINPHGSSSSRGRRRARLTAATSNRIRNLIPMDDDEDLRFRKYNRQSFSPPTKIQKVSVMTDHLDEAEEKEEEEKEGTQENGDISTSRSFTPAESLRPSNDMTLEEYLQTKNSGIILERAGQKPIIKCRFCPFQKFMGVGCKSAVVRHERCHFIDGPFSCTLCTFSTNNWNSIKLHREMHENLGQYQTEPLKWVSRRGRGRGKRAAKTILSAPRHILPAPAKEPDNETMDRQEDEERALLQAGYKNDLSVKDERTDEPRVNKSKMRESDGNQSVNNTPPPHTSTVLDLSPRAQSRSKQKTVGAMLEAAKQTQQLTYASDGSLDLSTTPKKAEEDRGSIKSEADDIRGRADSEDNLYTPSPEAMPIKTQPREEGEQAEKAFLKCAFCPFKTGGRKSSKAVLVKHQMCHSTNKKFACVACNYSSDSNEHMHRHLILHKPEDREVTKNGIPMAKFKKRRRTRRVILSLPTKRKGLPTTVRDYLAGPKVKNGVKKLKFKPKIMLGCKAESTVEEELVPSGEENENNEDHAMPVIENQSLSPPPSSSSPEGKKSPMTPVEDMDKDGFQLAPSLESIASGGRLKNVYHCRYCPFKTASCTPAGKVSLEKHEKCHGYNARFTCSACTFSTHYCDIIKIHVSLHEDVRATILNTKKIKKEKRSSVGEMSDAGSDVISLDSSGDSATLENALKNDKHITPGGSPETKKRIGLKDKDAETLAGKYLYKCRFCPFQTGANYASKYNLERHEKHHFTQGTFSCEKCGFSTNEYSVIRKHRKVHLQPNPPPPEGAVYKTLDSDPSNPRVLPKNNLVQKAVMPSGGIVSRYVPIAPKLPIQETINMASFSQVSDKIQETKKRKLTAWDLKPVDQRLVLSCKQCPFKTCGKSARAEYNLLVHTKCHLGLGKYKCHCCTFTTNKMDILRKHLLLHEDGAHTSVTDTSPTHSQPPRKRIKFSCSECEYVAFKSEAYQCHMMQHKQAALTGSTIGGTTEPLPGSESNGSDNAQGGAPSFLNLAPAPDNLQQLPSTTPIRGKGKSKKKMLEIPAELWWDAAEQNYACQWCDFTTKREYFFKVHLYCHQRKRVKFRCDRCGYGATRAAFLDQHINQHHKSPAAVEERKGKPKDLLQAVTEKMREKGMENIPIHTLFPSAAKVVPPIQQNLSVSPKKMSTGGTGKSPVSSPKKPPQRVRKQKWETAVPAAPVEEQRPTFMCTLCPFTTFSQEIESNHRGKHLRMDKHGCPYCTYSARTRVYLEKHVRLHFTAPLQDTALSNLPHGFSQDDTPTVADYVLQGYTQKDRNVEMKPAEPSAACRFCDVQLDGAKLKVHESRHLVGCGYLNYTADMANAFAE